MQPSRRFDQRMIANPNAGVVSPETGRRRVALISNLCPHYRQPLYDELARRMDLECFFFAETESYANPEVDPLMPSSQGTSTNGPFKRIQLKRINVLGQPLLPGLARRLAPDRYDAVISALSGRFMLPFVYTVARARRLPFILWTGVWHHPTTTIHRAT